MATAKKVIKRRRERKNVEKGQVCTSAPLSTTP